jgi:hypothetical protein
MSTKRKSLRFCQKIAESRSGMCLSSEYKNNRTHLLWRCKNEHIWEAWLNNVKDNNSWCPICEPKSPRRKTLQDCHILAKSFDGQCLAGEYKNNKTKISWKCKNGHVWEARYNDIDQGGRCPFCCAERRRQTNIEKYGVPYPQQVKEISLRGAQTKNQIVTLKHWLSAEDIKCRGSYEIAVVNHLNRNKIDYLWQPQTFLMPNGRTYTPDLYIAEKDLWVEIKGYFWGDAKEKWSWFQSEYENSELWDRRRLKEKGIFPPLKKCFTMNFSVDSVENVW